MRAYGCVCANVPLSAELSACQCGPGVGCMLHARVCGSSHHRPAPVAKRDPDSNRQPNMMKDGGW